MKIDLKFAESFNDILSASCRSHLSNDWDQICSEAGIKMTSWDILTR